MILQSISGFCREPLVQFFLLAIFLFGVDQALTKNANNTRRIVVDDSRLDELMDIFREGQGRDPSASELNNLIVKWSQNEILYREALELEMDQGDEMVRNRMVLKMRNVLFNRVIVDDPSDAELQEFFEFNHAQYDTPPRYDFELFAVAPDSSESAVEGLLALLNEPPVDERKNIPPPYENKVREYRQRPLSNLQSLFGDQASLKLTEQPVKHWIAVPADGTTYIVRVLEHYPAEPAILADIKSEVVRDWMKFRSDIQLADQTKAIADTYRIELLLSPDKQQLLNVPKVESLTKSPAKLVAH